MSARKSSSKNLQVVFENGETYIQNSDVDIYYRYRFWLFKVNHSLLLPGLRKDHRKFIYINGKRWGKAECRQGCIPLNFCLDDPIYLGTKITNWIKVNLGLGCRSSHRGYFYIKLGQTEYIVVRRFTKGHNVLCKIYLKFTQELIGSFIFDEDFTSVYPNWSSNRRVYVLYAIIGYVTDALIYSTVAKQLNRKINIMLG